MKTILLQLAGDTLVNSNTASQQTESLMTIYVLVALIAVAIWALFYAKSSNDSKVEKSQPPVISSSKPEPKRPTSQEVSATRADNSRKAVFSADSSREVKAGDKPASNVSIPVTGPSNQKQQDKPAPIEFQQKEQPKVIIEPEVDNSKSLKFIGYLPTFQFVQQEPFSYPLVLMPDEGSIIKFPRKGRVGNRGYTEGHFLKHIESHFRNHFQVYDDRSMVISVGQIPYEPDICLIDENKGLNIFIDIEIDEPYDGFNRRPTHVAGTDVTRDQYFSKRGWITIRFAEIQVWKHPEQCCAFLAQVVKTIHNEFEIPEHLEKLESLTSVPQWSLLEAKQMEVVKYRESYLGITSFGKLALNQEWGDITLDETENEVEEHVKKDRVSPETLKYKILEEAIRSKQYIACKIKGYKCDTILLPQTLTPGAVSAYCYIENKDVTFKISDLTNLYIRNKPVIQEIMANAGLATTYAAINTAISKRKPIRIVYFTPGWTDFGTGEIKEPSTKLRSISDLGRALDRLESERIQQYRLDENYLHGYCHVRNEHRTFKISRIQKLEVLNT